MHCVRALPRSRGITLRQRQPDLRSLQTLTGRSMVASKSSKIAESSRTASQRVAQLGRHMASSSTSSHQVAAGKHASSSSSAGPAGTEPISYMYRHKDLVKSGSNLGLRTLTLNRPKALNSLNKSMIDAIKPLLEGWEASQTCSIVLLKGEGRAFCAGGDVVALAKAAKHPATRSQATDFFKQEYDCDRFIAHMKKPVVAFMDGITMGGGVGLSVHAPFRIATEKTVFAMPETNIGLFPDVGANFFLSRLDGQLGVYLGLTSERISGYGVYQAGIATHFVPSDRLAALEERLAHLQFSEESPSTSQEGMQLINSCIEEFVGDADAGKSSQYDLIDKKREVLDSVFNFNRAEEIVSALKKVEEGNHPLVKGQDGSASLAEWAKKTRETIELRSPTSVKVALEGIRQGAKMNINEIFDLDMHLASIFCNPDLAPDFVTGVTHVLVDKKGAAKDGKAAERAAWSPNTLSELSQQKMRDTFFSDANSDKNARLPAPPKGSSPYTAYPHAAYALPSEQLIGRVIKGDVNDSGSFAMTRDEVYSWFEGEWAGKIGVREKVAEVMERRTTQQQDGTLKWKSSS